jgi:hypothetical protein
VWRRGSDAVIAAMDPEKGADQGSTLKSGPLALMMLANALVAF